MLLVVLLIKVVVNGFFNCMFMLYIVGFVIFISVVIFVVSVSDLNFLFLEWRKMVNDVLVCFIFVKNIVGSK